MQRAKKILSLFAGLLLSFALAACNTPKAQNTKNPLVNKLTTTPSPSPPTLEQPPSLRGKKPATKINHSEVAALQPAQTSDTKPAAQEKPCQDCLLERLQKLGEHLNLKIIFHASVTNAPCRVPTQLPAIKQFDAILESHNLGFLIKEPGLVMIYDDTRENNERFVKFEVEERFFSLQNVPADELEYALQSKFNGDSNHSINAIRESNTLLVRAPHFEMEQIAQSIGYADVEPAEAILHLEITGTSREVASEVGRQLAGAYDLTSILRSSLTSLLLPTGTLSLIRSAGKSKTLASVQLPVRHGKQTTIRIGRSSGSGITLTADPRISKDQVNVTLQFGATSTSSGGKGTISQELKTSANIPDGRTAILVEANFEGSDNSRSGIIGLDMLPALRRLFTIPKEMKDCQQALITIGTTITKPPQALPASRIRKTRSIAEAMATRPARTVGE